MAAFLAAIGCVFCVVFANLVAVVTKRLGGIPMPPPPGFTIGYAALLHLDAVGFPIVLPVTMIAAVLAAAVADWRATEGVLSRGLTVAVRRT